jgi:hypothetical protein
MARIAREWHGVRRGRGFPIAASQNNDSNPGNQHSPSVAFETARIFSSW